MTKVDDLRKRYAALLAPAKEAAELERQIREAEEEAEAGRRRQAALAEETARAEMRASAAAGLDAATEAVARLAKELIAALEALEGAERTARRVGVTVAAMPGRYDLAAALRVAISEWKSARPELFGLPPKPTMRERMKSELELQVKGLRRDIAAMERQKGRADADADLENRIRRAQEELQARERDLAAF